MNSRLWMNSLGLLLVAVILACPLSATAIDYKQYKRKKDPQSYFKISVDKKTISLSTPATDIREVKSYSLKKLKRDGSTINLGATPFISGLSITIGDEKLSLEKIVDTRILGDDDYITISFFDGGDDTARTSAIKRGNRIENSNSLSVGQHEFIRGIVFNPGGNIEILGEVNKDVITITGDIYIGPGAVVRGDVVAITGRVELANDASIYGEIFTFSKKPRSHRGRFSTGDKSITTTSKLIYNRVDGATLLMGARFEDADSALPTFSAKGGYAFASEAWRYDFGVEQLVLNNPAVSIGGSMFKRLATDDDWIIKQNDNTLFALLVTEDYLDYYEAKGGSVYLKFRPLEQLNIQSLYRYEETSWLSATPHLWSLFGGDKLFEQNFARVEKSFRTNSIDQIDSTTNAALSLSIDFDTHNEEQPFDFSGWHFTAELEFSKPDLKSDFDYRRYRISLRRYHAITQRSMLLLRVMYGASDGFLPLYRRFYLGGYGTLTGYQHKEFMGTEFWMTNSEYRIAFPGSDLALSLLWNAAQIANDTDLDRAIEVKHDLGIGFYLGSDIRLNLSKRLDRSSDDDFLFYFQFSPKF